MLAHQETSSRFPSYGVGRVFPPLSRCSIMPASTHQASGRTASVDGPPGGSLGSWALARASAILSDTGEADSRTGGI